MKIGFLYNHEELHQVAHTAPIISHLQRAWPVARIDVLSSSQAQIGAVRRHLDPQMPPPGIVHLKHSRMHELTEKLSGNVAPLGRVGCLSANIDLLRGYDVLVVPETTSTLLKTRFGLRRTQLVFVPHGAGDRSIGVSPEIAHFDLVLLPGPKTRDRMLAAGVIADGGYKIVGYPKFNSSLSADHADLFGNDKPVALYNPHFDPKLSSWYDFGVPLIEYFADQNRYNLIVAPHVMLFRRRIQASLEHRRLRRIRPICEKLSALPHIHIDRGSLNSVDMTYTRMADVYIGDVSSQIYEFIERPRPALFLNSHHARWQGNPDYAFWNFGPVVDDMADFPRAFAEAVPLAGSYEQAQQCAFRETFSLDPDQSSASAAADAIVQFAQERSGAMDGVVQDATGKSIQAASLPDPKTAPVQFLPKSKNAENDSGTWTAIVMAGERPGGNLLAEECGETYKALVKVGGASMLSRVCNTLLRARKIGRIVIVAQDPDALMGGDMTAIARNPKVSRALSHGGIANSIANISGTEIAPWPILVTTADHPLLRTETVEEFLAGTGTADLAVGVGERKNTERHYPMTRRTWLKFSDGQYSGANLFALRGAAALPALNLWAGIEEDRKRGLKIVSSFGPRLLIRVLSRTISFADGLKRAGATLGVTAIPVILSQPEAAMDVDKRSDLELAEAIIAAYPRDGLDVPNIPVPSHDRCPA